MVLIDIDITPFIEGLNITPQVINLIAQTAVIEATESIKSTIKAKARDELFRTRRDYIHAINVNYSNNGMSSLISLTGRLPMMIEEGIPPFDMKIGFANSPKAKRTEANVEKYRKSGRMDWQEKGWYLTIPFRLGTPGTIGEEFSGHMDKKIYNIAKNQLNIIKQERAIDAQGLTFVRRTYEGISLEQLEQLGSQYTQRMTNIRNKWISSPTAPPYTHVSPMNQGVVRIEAVYEKAVQATYLKFRRVSSKSDPNSWLHGGIKARKFFDKAMNETNFDEITEEATLTILEELL